MLFFWYFWHASLTLFNSAGHPGSPSAVATTAAAMSSKIKWWPPKKHFADILVFPRLSFFVSSLCFHRIQPSWTKVYEISKIRRVRNGTTVRCQDEITLCLSPVGKCRQNDVVLQSCNKIGQHQHTWKGSFIGAANSCLFSVIILSDSTQELRNVEWTRPAKLCPRPFNWTTTAIIFFNNYLLVLPLPFSLRIIIQFII